MCKYLGILFFALAVLLSCSKECDQEFFFIDLKPEYNLSSECIELGESFNMTLQYTDTLRAFSGVVLTEFDTIYQQNDTIVTSENIDEINLIDIKTYNFTTSITFHRLNDSVNNIDEHARALEDFDVMVTNGNGVETSDNFDPGFFRSFDPNRGGGVSNLQLTIIPKTTGSYYVTLVHGNAGVFEDPIVADGCDDLILASYENNGLLNENVLWQATDSSHISMDDLEDLSRTKAIFFFKVVESGATECL